MTEKICNDLVIKLKAHGSNKDFCDLAAAHEEYHTVLNKLPSNEKTSFSLNVLCILCRNLEKVPSWRNSIDNKDFLKLCIDCVRHTRGVTGEPQVKTLAAIYHVHKYIVKQNVSSIPPELVLKLSIMPFESDILLKEYYKTYWSVLADRITYIEKLKPLRIPIVKLFPKLNEDLSKVIKIYADQNDFCKNILPFIVKKLNVIYVDVSLSNLNKTYQIIFDNIRSYDLSGLKDEHLEEIYTKFSECVYVITEISSKSDFKDSPLDEIVRTCLSLLGHRPDIFHCLQTFYLNSFMYIFSRPKDAENVFRNMLVSCETTEKLGYKSIMVSTYPYLNQLLRLCIEYYQRKKFELNENCLNLILFLMEKVKNCKQLIKCENCKIQTGYHDALRLSFLVKNIVNLNTKEKLLYSIIDEQYDILKTLRLLKCTNHEKYYAKLVSDTHNTAIQFYKSQQYDFAIRLFDFCIKNEFETQNKNLCRALYNKSICEADRKLYVNALKDAFLSMVFDNGQNVEKYMSLVLDIKGKAVNNEVENSERIQLMSVLDACDEISEYENLVPMLRKVKFSDLLKQEFSIYVKLWPSLVPITGVIRSLNNMLTDKYEWTFSEDKTIIKNILYDVMLKTPDVVRTIQEANFKGIVEKVIENMEYNKLPLNDKMVYIALLMMKSEHDLQDASDRFGWKQAEHTFDPSKSTVYKSILDEYNASKDSIRAVELLTTLKSEIKNVSSNRLPHVLYLCEMTIFQLLHLERTVHALQLAHLGLRLANLVGDKVSFVRCAGVLLFHAGDQRTEFDAIAMNAVKVCAVLLKDRQTADPALVFLCELGIYYARCKKLSIAAQLLRKAEKCVVDLIELCPGVHLDLAIGKIMELGVMMSDVSLLSAVNIIQRHYLTAQPTETTWLSRRRHQLQIRVYIQQASVTCASVCNRLKLWRRAKTAAGAALTPSGSAAHGRLFALLCDPCRPDDAKIKIDNRLKYILGLTREIKPQSEDAEKTPPKSFKYENIEVSLNCLTIGDKSPTSSYTSVPAFHMPAFLDHVRCACYACAVPACSILACLTASLEASTFFRSKEAQIARNYFEGATESFKLAEAKLKSIDNSMFEEYIADAVQTRYLEELRTMEVDFLIEYAFFELSKGRLDRTNELTAKICGICQNVDAYVKNEISNLMIATCNLSKPKRAQMKHLEVEFDNLKLTEVPKTPESKVMPKFQTPKIVINEEVPKRLKPFNKLLDFDKKEETPKREKPKFKVPEPKISKPNVETVTPRPSRSRPKVAVEESPQEFFTPKSPEEKFFTPLPRTYLRPKNLEAEFLTPSEPKRSLRKKALLRATSPGKLETVGTRSRRVKQPNFDD
ncbi:uncharacterized protein LOC123718115 [Pieris brassicae]|uniref:uncharacterized protein LOC123718115 n=1 Tax=Pieris brassicae TaxID=7116 RepID=UPI001E65F00D|nr:uncharacterized protein LOC123718115 [Pieris brassicae]